MIEDNNDNRSISITVPLLSSPQIFAVDFVVVEAVTAEVVGEAAAGLVVTEEAFVVGTEAVEVVAGVDEAVAAAAAVAAEEEEVEVALAFSSSRIASRACFCSAAKRTPCLPSIWCPERLFTAKSASALM